MTLIDSRPAIIAAFEAMSRDMSVSVDLNAVDGRLGVKLENELAYWFPADGIAATASCYPSAMRPWTPEHDGLQRYMVTHDGAETKRPASARYRS